MHSSNLRHGYTTGACAAAAAQAAAHALLTGQPVTQVQIDLPAGITATFAIKSCQIEGDKATASVIKDAGDDPDITNGAEIVTTVQYSAEPGIAIEGGQGVGRVTRPGLGLPTGGPAINPVPRKMILQALQGDPLYAYKGSPCKVTISVPNGERLAQRTLNPRLGIIGGISILGTTGLVIPFSHDAYKTSISLALDVAVASECREVTLSTGGRSEKFARKVLDLPLEAFVQMGDFAGFSLDECLKRGIRHVYLCAFIGKLSKIASGNFATHVSHGQLSPDFLPAMAVGAGIPSEAAAGLRSANTARHFQEMVQATDNSRVLSLICQTAARKAREYTGRKLEIECLLFDFDGQLLARADGRG